MSARCGLLTLSATTVTFPGTDRLVDTGAAASLGAMAERNAAPTRTHGDALGSCPHALLSDQQASRETATHPRLVLCNGRETNIWTTNEHGQERGVHMHTPIRRKRKGGRQAFGLLSVRGVSVSAVCWAQKPRLPLPTMASRGKAAAPSSRAKGKGGKPELTEEQKQEIREAFDLFDTDGSGALGALLPARPRAQKL